MAFWLYKKADDHYTRLNSLKFGGKNGLLARFLQSNAAQDTPFSWQLESEGLIELIDPSLNASEHEVVIDMLPEAMTEVCLYRVTSLRGVSEYDESDMVLACKILQQGPTKEAAISFKESFTVTTEPSSRQVVEAFHLAGGIATGTYRLGKPKMNIGAAICPPDN